LTVLKVADDKQREIDALQALISRSDVNPPTKKRIEEEIWRIRAGMKGEKDAAYEIDFYYAAGDNHVVIHDLRVEFKGRVAQIDHLILNRAFDIWVCESKSFSEGVKIDEHGEWYRYGGRFARGMPSPVKQNARHVDVLRDLFDSGGVQLPRRFLTMKPNLWPIVLISNKARIDRPKSKRAAAAIDGLETVIKVERLVETINRSIDTRNPVKLIAKVVGNETIADLGRQLVALHKPESIDWFTFFGIPPRPLEAAVPSSSQNVAGAHRVCSSCGSIVTDKVARYSLEHPERFGGQVLCWNCQRSKSRTRARA
jgi:nuclease-like protein